MLCDSERNMGGGDGLCAACRRKCRTYTGPKGLQGMPLFVPYVYQGPTSALIQGLKYQGKRYMARPLSVSLAALISRVGLTADAIVPMPIHINRRKERGFNQTEEIGRRVAELTGIPMRTDFVQRVKDTAHQVGMNAEQRQKNVEAAFTASQQAAGLRVLLLDDVCTTGATLGACGAALRAAGAEVICLCAASVEK